MARYRVGDKYLSEEEHNEHISEIWKGCIFCISALFFGGMTMAFLRDFDIPKEVKLGLIVLVSLFSGYLMAKLSNVIRIALGIAVVGFIAWNILYFLWGML